jgi:hypothetical protein
LGGLTNSSNWWNEDIYSAPGVAHAATGLQGVATSRAASQLALAGGSMLATSGLFGTNRGTGLGIAESGFGGAMAGFGIGNMIMPGVGGLIGGAIGGVAGLGAGIGEKLAGDLSPREQAKNLVSSTYHISISNPMADQIASIASSKYGGMVGAAVRSPEVRQMLGVYAAGTGQGSHFPMSTNTPYGGGVTESGGKMYQTPVYEYGVAHSYQSSLPVYGGNPGGSLPSPGGGSTYLSMNVSGKDAANFMTGEYVTPNFVQSQATAAWNGSNGRTDNAMLFGEAGSIVG